MKTFDGTCQMCGGSGVWQQRVGYPCKGCKATGKATVGLVEMFGGMSLRVLGGGGKPTKQKYNAEAELTAPLDRYNCGMTVGHGWYKDLICTDPAGSKCAVYGRTKAGELLVALPNGGFGVTGGEIQVRIIEDAARMALEIAP